jgi:hypothetical protein
MEIHPFLMLVDKEKPAVVDAMNSYVFNTLRFEPHMKPQGNNLPRVQLFFDQIFFDMSEEHPRARSANPAADGKGKSKTKR